MTRILKLSIFAVFFAVPFWGCAEGRLRPGSRAFAANGCPLGTKVEVLRDDDLDPTAFRRIEVKVIGGEFVGETWTISRSHLNLIDNTIGGAK